MPCDGHRAETRANPHSRYRQKMQQNHLNPLWHAFVLAHAEAQLAGTAEIPMDYFTRAVESVLIQGPRTDLIGLELDAAHWQRAVRDSGYVAAQRNVQPHR